MGTSSAAGMSKLDTISISGKNYIQDVRIEIATTSPADLRYNDAGMMITSLHEMGHALGLWGHSNDPNDVMYVTGPAAGAILSARDVLSINALYSLTPDIKEAPEGTKVRTPSSEYVID